MTDPIADLLTRIRNGVHVERPFVDVPFRGLRLRLWSTAARGFVWDHEVVESGNHRVLRVNLKYGPNGEHVIQHIEPHLQARVSRVHGCE